MTTLPCPHLERIQLQSNGARLLSFPGLDPNPPPPRRTEVCVPRWGSSGVTAKPAPFSAPSLTPPFLLSSPPLICPPSRLTSPTHLAFGPLRWCGPPPCGPPTRIPAVVPRRIWVTDRAETPAPRAAVLAQVEEDHRGQRRIRQPFRLGVHAARVLFRRPRPRPSPGSRQVVEPHEAPGLS